MSLWALPRAGAVGITPAGRHNFGLFGIQVLFSPLAVRLRFALCFNFILYSYLETMV